MANRTVKDAVSVKGTNPQYLIEKIVRSRIYESRYWKEDCFALTAELLVDKAMELKYVGGVYGGNIRPTPFICLVLKMLQIQPEKDIVVEFIRNEEFKYVRFLGAFYMRLTGTSLDIYKYIEPLYVDYSRMKLLNRSGKFELVHMDELVDLLIHNDRCCDISLPRIQKRNVLEELNQLEIRVSPLEYNLEEESSESGEDEEEEEQKENERNRRNGGDDSDKKKARKRSHSRSRSPKPSSRQERRKYHDYDEPSESRYRRSESPRRRRERSESDERRSSRHKRERDRDRSRDREKERRHKKKSSKHKHRSRSESSRSSRSRSRSKERKKSSKKDKHRSRSRSHSDSRSSSR